uniref:Methylenetetrahydrofolate dehydrogenase (NADP+) / methenyltetrahydrofolate cyclohydrolase n=1 Tax=Rhipicephalus appendiculatus TaxID=34631 RepID=A0A131Z307_RHIAP
MVKADWVKPGAVVIDCGINAIPGAHCSKVHFLNRSGLQAHAVYGELFSAALGVLQRFSVVNTSSQRKQRMHTTWRVKQTRQSTAAVN